MNFHAGVLVALLGTASALVSGDAEASMRCGNKLASPGDSTYFVRDICGEPDAAERRSEQRTLRQRVVRECIRDDRKALCEETVEHTVEVLVDEWTYDFGRNRFIRYLTFEQGKLVRIDTGSYGRKAPSS